MVVAVYKYSLGETTLTSRANISLLQSDPTSNMLFTESNSFLNVFSNCVLVNCPQKLPPKISTREPSRPMRQEDLCVILKHNTSQIVLLHLRSIILGGVFFLSPFIYPRAIPPIYPNSATRSRIFLTVADILS